MSVLVRVAVLIDCDNISHRLAGAVLAEAASVGTLSVKRGYGDWSSPRLTGWAERLPCHAIDAVHQPVYVPGKNASDTALVIDAMDLLYAGTIDVFFLVSSDSDFTRLAMRLRESGRRVHGVGAQRTPLAFQNACDTFTVTDALLPPPAAVAAARQPPLAESSHEVSGAALVQKGHQQAGRGAHPGKVPRQRPDGSGRSASAVPAPVGRRGLLGLGGAIAGQPPPAAAGDLEQVLSRAVAAVAREDGWAPLSTVGAYLMSNQPSFDARDHGYPRLGALVRDLPALQVKTVPGTDGSGQPWVRVAAQPAV